MEQMTRSNSYRRKLGVLRDILSGHQADALCLTSQAATTWLTGARSFINMAVDAACFKVVVTPDEAYVVVNNIEARRLQDEELRGLDIDVRPFQWYEAERIPDDVLWEAQFIDRLRAEEYVLDVYEQDMLRQISEDTRMSVEQVMKTFAPGLRERDLAALLTASMMEHNLEPVVMLVAGDERTKLRRHPLPTDNRITTYALAAVCGRRQGLIASVTRSVSFGAVPSEMITRQDAAAYVDSVAIASTQPQRTLSGIFERITQAYAQVGFDGEWRHHHQGGITGYYTRATLAKPNSDIVLQPGMAMAWNPSVQGTKTEDTCLIGANGAELLT